MSPSEFDLRAALHDGEGDPVDPNPVIAAGRAQAAHRRNQWRTGAVTAVLVAGVVGVGAVAFGGNNDTESGGANSSATHRSAAAAGGQAAPNPAAPRRYDLSASAASRSAAAVPKASDAAACPPAAPAPPAANAGKTTTQMFAKPVADLLICSYESGAGAKPQSVTLSGAQARQLAASLEDASTTRPTGLCPAYVRADQRTVRILARSTDGTSLAPVIATLNAPSCRVVVSNGTAVRYGWAPPVTVRPALRQLLTDVPAAPKQGSPVHT